MKSYKIDMCNGPLVSNMLAFTIPLIFTGVLQLFFNAADTVVVGRYTGERALAAVGSTTSLINLLLNLVIGISMGTGIIIGRNYGAVNKRRTRNSVHTAIATAIISGFIMLVAGIILTKPMLKLMGTPEDVIDLSILYMHIFFIGMPSSMLYNFGASILRAVGDTKRSLFILAGAGVVNIILNLILVIVFHLGVAGVAIATIISEAISAFFILKILMKDDGPLHLEWKKVRIHLNCLRDIIKYGLPAGIQGILFNISNVIIQSSINSFGSMAVAGNTAALTIEGFIYASTNAVYQTSLNFTSQNTGARNYKRVDKILILSVIFVFILGNILGTFVYIFGDKLLRISLSAPEALSYGLIRIGIVGTTYALCGIMDVSVGILRGLGFPILPTMVTLIGACIFRLVWIFTVFRKYHELSILYLSYPISWIITAIILIICYVTMKKKKFYII